MTPAMIDTSAAHMVRDNANVSFAVDAVLSVRRFKVSASSVRMSVVLKSYIGTAFNMDLADTSCILWSVHCCLSDRCFYMRKTTQTEIFAAIADPDKICCCSDSTKCTCRSWRRIRLSDGYRCRRQDGCSTASSWFR